MPGLVLFNRRWMVASDELVLPFGLGVITRVSWILVVGAIYIYHHFEHVTKPMGSLTWLDYYFVGYLVLLFVSTLNDAIVAFISSRGSIFDKHRRKSLPLFLYIRALILGVELGMGCGGCYITFGEDRNVFYRSSYLFAQLVCVFNIVWAILSLFIAWMTFDSAGYIWYVLERKSTKARDKYSSIDTLDFQQRFLEANERYWTQKCRFLFCCTKAENSRDSVLLFAAKLFSKYFGMHHDIVPSDILAGMILLRKKQKLEEITKIEEMLVGSTLTRDRVTIKGSYKSVKKYQHTPNSIPFDVNNKVDMKILDEVTFFAKYALACYGWPMYCFLNKIPICKKEGFRLLERMKCCSCCCCWGNKSEDGPIVEGDNCCLCNLATQKTILDVGDENFIYVSYEDKVFKTPFNVIVDKSKGAIVISCRGTLSLHDILTDLACDEVLIPGYEEEKWTAHHGFLEAAMEMKEIIKKKKLIEKAQEFDVEKGSRNYRIILVGHSLGAGTATVLAFLLRLQYPHLVCFAYGPPGASICYEAACFARKFIYSVVLGKDLIGRLNLHTMHELMYNIMQLLRSTKLPKWKILRGCMDQCFRCCTRSVHSSFDEYFPEGKPSFKRYSSTSITKLYMAGKVVHICKTRSLYPRRGCGKKKAIYKGYWSVPEDFQSILISNLMLRDHFPDALIKALSSLLQTDDDGDVGKEGEAQIRNRAVTTNTFEDPNMKVNVTVDPRIEDLNENTRLVDGELGNYGCISFGFRRYKDQIYEQLLT